MENQKVLENINLVKQEVIKASTNSINAKLKKYGVTSPSQLKGDDEKKFYNEIDKEWQGDNEED